MQERDQQALERGLERLRIEPGAPGLGALAALVAWLRPPAGADPALAAGRLQQLTARLEADDLARTGLARVLRDLLERSQALRLLSDSGILPAEGLVGGLWRRLGHRLLPEERQEGQLHAVLQQLFDHRDDHVWVEAIDDETWAAFLDVLALPPLSAERMPLQILEALQVLSYRVAALGLEPELVRNYPAVERYASPFLTQNQELHAFSEEHRRALAERRAPTLDDRHLRVLLQQCREILVKVRRQASQSGASVGLTVLLVRLGQHLERLEQLLCLLEPQPVHALNRLRMQLFKALVRAENLRDSLSDGWRQTVELLAVRITGNASQTGEHYVTATRSEYFRMLRAGLGAGCIVSLMAMIKLELGEVPHAPLAAALLYSLNYGLGFVLIYLLHFTIATKQPAMTASYLAASLASVEAGRDRLAPLEEQVVRTLRSQFIAIVGNVLPAFLLPLALAWAIAANGEAPYLDAAQAQSLLEDQHPLRSLAWFHAALAGVCLFLAGLISGYFDNQAVYNRIPQRLRQHRRLQGWLGAPRLERLASYIEHNLGALAGNFFFGCMLGSLGVIGFILGLPLDIRHVTFSSAYAGYAGGSLGSALDLRLAIGVAVGVAGIAVINLAVSFGLALWVALRAQKVRFADARELRARLWRRFRLRPQDYFWPPRES